MVHDTDAPPALAAITPKRICQDQNTVDYVDGHGFIHDQEHAQSGVRKGNIMGPYYSLIRDTFYI